MSRNSDPSVDLGFIGGATSTLFTLALFIRNLKANEDLGDKKITLNILDPKGLNGGLAYNVKSMSAKLNQPAGQEMDGFNGDTKDLPPSFLKWLQSNHEGYDALSRAPRKLYGDYLLDVGKWIKNEIDKLPNVTLKIIETKAVAVKTGGSSAYTIIGENGRKIDVDGLVLATGHTTSPRATHPNYIAAYVGHDFEGRLQAAAKNNKQKIDIIGSGASAIETISMLEEFGNASRYVVHSPYGNTGWLYNSSRPEPSEEQKAALVQTTLEFHTRSSVSAIQTMRFALNKAEKQGIGPQYVLGVLINNPTVQKDSELLAATKACYGNPLSPERIELLNLLEHQGRLEYVTGRVEKITTREGNLYADFGRGAQEVTNRIVDCAVVNRGIHNRAGEIADPLIARLLEGGIIRISPDLNSIDFRPSPGKPVWALGPPTQPHRNGVGTFRGGYAEAAKGLVEFVVQLNLEQTLPRNTTPARQLAHHQP